MRTRLLSFVLVASVAALGCSNDSEGTPSDTGTTPGASGGSGGAAGSGGGMATAGKGGSGGSKAGAGGSTAGAGGSSAGAGGNAAGAGGSSAGAGGSAAGSGGSNAGAGGSSAGAGGSNAGAGGSSAGAGGSSAGAGGSSAGAGGAGGMVSVSVTPATATMLTCSTKAFSAGGASVTWKATDGTIDATGNYTAPKKVGPDVTITATSTVDTSVSGTATVTLETANVGTKQIVVDDVDHYPDVWAHAVAASGNVVYAAWGYGGNNDAAKVQVARSDDGGATWGTPVTASPAIDMNSDVSCIDLAIDAGDPNVVYVVFNFTAGSGLPVPYTGGADMSDDQGLALVASTDGGKTFPTFKILQAGNSSDPIPVAQGICPDVASPKADTVAVSTPGGSNDQSIFLWVDASRGTGIGIGQVDSWNMIASEETGALHAIGADVGQNGGEGDTTEAPQLFSDGKGTLCITYVAYTPKGSGSPSSAIWLQCSKDLGQTFTGPTIVSPTFSSSEVHLGHPTGLFAPNGDIVVAWRGFGVETAVGGSVAIAGTAISTDGGSTFTDISPAVLQDPNSGITNAAGIGDIEMDDTGVLWRTYVVGDGLTSRIAVDKTCDLGMTWSGPQVINAPASTPDDATLPMLVATPGGQVAVYASASGNAGITYQMRRYTIAP